MIRTLRLQYVCWLFYLIEMLFPFVLYADQKFEKYTLNDCIKIALEQSATAKNAFYDKQIADAQILQRRSEAFPHLTLSSDYMRLDKLQEVEFGDQLIDIGTLDNYSVAAEINQTLYSGGRVGAAIRASGFMKSRAFWLKNEADASLVKDVKIAFNNILLAKAAVKVREDSLKQLNTLLKQSKERFKNGVNSEFDLISTRVKVSNEKPYLIAAKNIYDTAREGFKRMLALDSSLFELTGDLDFTPLNTTFQELNNIAIEKRAILHAYETECKLREQAVAAARSGKKPNINLFGNYNGANSYRFVSFGEKWEWHWNIGLSLSWNVWDGWLTRGIIKEKNLDLEKSRIAYEDIKSGVKLELTQAYLDMQHAEESVKASEEGVSLAKKAFNIAVSRYNSGLSTYIEYTDANVALSKAKLSYFIALRNHMNAVVRLKYASGIILSAKEKELIKNVKQ